MKKNLIKTDSLKCFQSNNKNIFYEVYNHTINEINNKYLENEKKNQNNTFKKYKKKIYKKLNQSSENVINFPVKKKKKKVLSVDNTKIKNYNENSRIIQESFIKFKEKKQSKRKNKTFNFSNKENEILHRDENKLNILKLLFLLYILAIFIISSLRKKNKISNKDSIDNINYDNNTIIHTKKLIYTIIIGHYEKLKKFNKQDGWDYYAFIEPNTIPRDSTNWTILPFPENVKNLPINDVKKQRYIKTHPHLFFQNYSLSIYVDGSFIITGDLNEFVLRVINPNYNIFVVEHPYRKFINDEIREVLLLKKEKLIMGEIIYDKYEQENFTNYKGLLESNIIIRKHNKNDSIELMEKWWNEINNYSHRDQLSFNYVLWKTGINIKYFSTFILYDYFEIDNLHKMK